MSDVRLVGTNPADGSLIPVAVTSAGLLKTKSPVIELIDNDLTITGDLIVGGTINGEESGGGGSGLPEPYGPEGSVLTIVSGEPTWALPPVEPSDLSLSFSDPWIYQDADGNTISTPSDWETAVKSTQNWADPLGSAKDGWAQNTLCSTECRTFDVDVQNAFGKVLTIWIKTTLTPTHNFNPGVWGSALTPSNANIVPIQNTFEFPGSTPDGSGKVGPYGAAYSFLINRDDAAGSMTFTDYGPPGGYFANLTDMSCQVTKWELETSAQYQLRRRNEIRSAREEFRNDIEGPSTHSRSDYGY